MYVRTSVLSSFLHGIAEQWQVADSRSQGRIGHAWRSVMYACTGMRALVCMRWYVYYPICAM